MIKRGKFIVIDGIDGSGKATQTALLVERLRALKKKVEKVDFPRYQDNVFGALVGECLRGDHGDFLNLDPRIASTLYAADRFESSAQIESWLKAGRIVIADRYVSSNQLHQGGKIKDDKARLQFLTWLDRIEYGVFKIPRPDAIIYLDLPIEVSQRLLKEKTATDKKSYLKGKKDTVEEDAEYLENARQSGLKIIRKNNQWFKINCAKGGEILSREVIADLVFARAQDVLGLK